MTRHRLYDALIYGADILAGQDMAREIRYRQKADTLCSDCPPIGYPTNKTRCLLCPRWSDKAEQARLAAVAYPEAGDLGGA